MRTAALRLLPTKADVQFHVHPHSSRQALSPARGLELLRDLDLYAGRDGTFRLADFEAWAAQHPTLTDDERAELSVALAACLLGEVRS